MWKVLSYSVSSYCSWEVLNPGPEVRRPGCWQLRYSPQAHIIEAFHSCLFGWFICCEIYLKNRNDVILSLLEHVSINAYPFHVNHSILTNFFTALSVVWENKEEWSWNSKSGMFLSIIPRNARNLSMFYSFVRWNLSVNILLVLKQWRQFIH